MSFFMSIEFSPEIISDEQLEEVAGGLADVENNSCVALYQATAQINCKHLTKQPLAATFQKRWRLFFRRRISVRAMDVG
jgi:hypothetical protein